MDLNEARKLKELERENGELKKMLAEALLKNRVLEAVAEKMVSPVHRHQARPRRGQAWAVLRADGVPLFAARPSSRVRLIPMPQERETFSANLRT